MKVLKYPHPILTYTSKPIAKINKELRSIVAEMFATMYETKGVGLAANQVGLPFRLFVMNPTGDPEQPEEERVYINPVILKRSGKAVDNEGCLSFPGIYVDVLRAEIIEVEAIDLAGEVRQSTEKGHVARIIQHETDHLNGTGFVDRLSETARMAIKKELEEMETIFQGDCRLGFILPNKEFVREIAQLEERFCLR